MTGKKPTWCNASDYDFKFCTGPCNSCNKQKAQPSKRTEPTTYVPSYYLTSIPKKDIEEGRVSSY